jgi:hypothetical protein
VARAIDAFNAVDAMNWGELSVLQWLIRGGLKCSARGFGNIGMDVDGDGKNKGGESESDNDGGLFVKQTVPGPDLDNVNGMDIDSEVAGPSTQGPASTGTSTGSSGNALSLNPALQAITAQVLATMRRLHMGVDYDVLAQAFENLGVKDRRPRKNGNPFIDDSDSDDAKII